jgi:SAM-dependent methyltransferase
MSTGSRPPDDGSLQQIRAAYARRRAVYDPAAPWVHRTGQELERALVDWIGTRAPGAAADLRLREVGCGSGRNLLRFLQLGFKPENLVGNDLLEERIAAAREMLPAKVQLTSGDASRLGWPDGSFDVVFQSMMCTSILDDDLLRRACQRIWDLARPGGGVLWYDFTVDNPSNPDVRGIGLRALRGLFPAARLEARRVTLAPPLSRLVTRVHPALYGWLNLLPLLRTHVLVWMAKT